MPEHLPRLDILIYAHDGRGLGHASRSITVGMALRRLYPDLKVLFVSGCKVSRELIGGAPLDWLKLPSYKTRVVEGKSRGIDGYSMFSDRQLGEFRAAELKHLVTLYRPKVVLCDHTPQGKHRELIPALQASCGTDTRWVLGVRGVVGGVAQVRSENARKLFMASYHALLWYGDSAVLGTEHLTHLQELYCHVPVECGYVCRLAELCSWQGPAGRLAEQRLAGTIAVPWLGEESVGFLQQLAEALAGISQDYGRWQIFVDPGDSPLVQDQLDTLFSPLQHCRLNLPAGERYVEALLNSRSALVYGGYNSIMDVLYARIPALILLRGMQDNEQRIHLEKLMAKGGGQLSILSESGANATDIRRILLENVQRRQPYSSFVNLGGAEKAAKVLYRFIADPAGSK